MRTLRTVRDRSFFAGPVGQLLGESAFLGLVGRRRVVGDQPAQARRVTLGGEVARPVDGMEAGLNQLGGVPEVVPPGSDDEEVPLVFRHCRGQLRGSSGNLPGVLPAGAERGEQAAREVRGGGRPGTLLHAHDSRSGRAPGQREHQCASHGAG